MISEGQYGEAMEVSEAIKERRSVRSFREEQVPEEILAKVIEAGRLAPSANNRQPWHFIVVKDSVKREVLSEGKYAKFLTKCPVVIVGCGDKVRSEKWYAVDLAISLENMVIEATSEGLGTCWIGSFSNDSVKNLLKIPENFDVVAMLALGYPKDTPVKDALLGRSSRKRAEEIISWEEFGRPKTR